MTMIIVNVTSYSLNSHCLTFLRVTNQEIFGSQKEKTRSEKKKKRHNQTAVKIIASSYLRICNWRRVKEIRENLVENDNWSPPHLDFDTQDSVKSHATTNDRIHFLE